MIDFQIRMKSFWGKICCILCIGVLAVVMLSCGGHGGRTGKAIPGPYDNLPSLGSQISLAMLKSSSGAPQGVRISFWRVNLPDVVGYYIYRDESPILTKDPTKRVNNGEMVPQPPPSESIVVFLDFFNAEIGKTYYYRVTSVDNDGDESVFSDEASITISSFSVFSFSPTSAPVGTLITINGENFGTYDPNNDKVEFTGVVDTKRPSALTPGKVQAVVTPDRWLPNRIQVYVPEGATVGPLTITVGGVSLDTEAIFTNLSPYITSVTPDPVTSGEILTFQGNNLGERRANNRLLLNDVPYNTIQTWTPTEVTALVPYGIETGLYEVRLRVERPAGGFVRTNGAYTDIIGLPFAPVLTKVSPQWGDAGTTEVTLEGQNFGTDPSKFEVLINGASVSGSSFNFFSDTLVKFNLPVGLSRTGYVQAIIHAAEDLQSNTLRYFANVGEPSVIPTGAIIGFEMGKYSDVEYDSTGQIHLIYTDTTANSTNVLFYSVGTTSSGFTEEPLEFSAAEKVGSLALAIDGADNLHLTYLSTPAGASSVDLNYAYFDGSSWTNEVIDSFSGLSVSEPVDIAVFGNSGSVDRIVGMRIPGTGVTIYYKLSGETTWSNVLARGESDKQSVGYHLAIDLLDSGYEPPNQSLPYEVGIAYSGFDSSDGIYFVEFTFSFDLTNFFSQRVDSADTEVLEVDTEYFSDGYWWYPSVLYTTSTDVIWSAPFEGWLSELVVSGSSPRGRGSRLVVYPSQPSSVWVVGQWSSTSVFIAQRDMVEGGWDVSTVSVSPDTPDASGRWGLSVNPADGQDLVLSYFNSALTDPAVLEITPNGSAKVAFGDKWHIDELEISSQSIVVAPDSRPRAVFTHRLANGQKQMYLAEFVGTLPQGTEFPHLDTNRWKVTQIDSVTSGQLGRASVVAGSDDSYHLAFIKTVTVGQSDPQVLLHYGKLSGTTLTSQPISVVGNVSRGPQIAIGPTDSYIAVLCESATDNNLQLIWTWNSFSGVTTEIIFQGPPLVPSYDVAFHYNQGFPVVAYYNPNAGGVVIKDFLDDSEVLVPGSAGFDYGITLTMDETDHASVTASDLAGTKAGKWIHWDPNLGTYVVSDFVGLADASLTLSQARTVLGPVVSSYYISPSSLSGHVVRTSFYDGISSWSHATIASTNGSSVPILHSLDTFSSDASITLIYGGSEFYNNLAVFPALRP